MPDQQSSLRGIWAVNLSMFSYVVGDVIIKLLGRDIPSIELVFIRSIVIAVALAVLMAIKRHRLHVARLASVPLLARCFFEVANNVAFTFAIVHMRIGELYAVLGLTPLLMTAMSAILYKEPVGLRRWIAIAVGFAGVLLVVKPDIHALDHWALAGFLVSLTGAARDTVTRQIDADTPTIEVTFYSVVAVGIATLVIGSFEPWIIPNHLQGLSILALTGTWLFATSLLISACRLIPLSLVASFRYTLLVWGTLAGYVVFGDKPDVLSYIGAALIAGSGLYVFHREAVRHRALASATIPLSQ